MLCPHAPANPAFIAIGSPFIVSASLRHTSQGLALAGTPRTHGKGRFPAPPSALDFAMPAGGRLAQHAASRWSPGAMAEKRLETMREIGRLFTPQR